MRDTMAMRRDDKAEWRRRGIVVAVVLVFGLGAVSPAWAQFSLFGSREVSPEDVSDTIAEHGFRLVGPLYRNGRMFLADVIDRRQNRERLVISAESGQIVQRFLVDVGSERRQAPVSRQAPRDDSFFSHLTRGWDDAAPPRPPLGLDGPDGLPPVSAPAAPRPRPQPKVVTRTDAGQVPVTAAPLPPTSAAVPGPAPQAPASSKPEVVSVPSSSPGEPNVSAPSNLRGTSVSVDPLRIPGTRKTEDAKPAPAAIVAKAPEAPTAPTKPKAVPAADVPVAPLD